MEPNATIQLGKPTAATLAIICVLGLISVCTQLVDKWGGGNEQRAIGKHLERLESKLDAIDANLKEQIKTDAAQNERITRIEAQSPRK